MDKEIIKGSINAMLEDKNIKNNFKIFTLLVLHVKFIKNNYIEFSKK